MDKPVAEQMMGSRDVCTDLIKRLQNNVPQIIPPPGTMPKMPEEKINAIEEGLKVLQDKLAQMMAPSSSSPAPDAEKVMADKITAELQEVLDAFNKGFEEWTARTRCVANLVWNYKDGKKLEIAGVDYIVYRREPPSSKTIKEAMDKVPQS